MPGFCPTTLHAIETFVDRLASRSGHVFTLEGAPLEPQDMASPRGALPLLVTIVRTQASTAAAVLPPDTHQILFGWLDDIVLKPDPRTLTGLYVAPASSTLTRGFSLYAMGATLVLAVDFIVSTSPTPNIHLDPFLEEFSHVGSAEPSLD